MSDPIADMLARLATASARRKREVVIPFSALKLALAELLAARGFVGMVEKRGKGVERTIEIKLAYTAEGEPKLQHLRRVSKPSQRMYAGAADLPSVRRGRGMTVVSTPKGLLSDRDARRLRVGGELLCEVW